MSKRLITTILFFCAAYTISFAHAGNNCSGRKKMRKQMKTTIASHLENYYDVKRLHFDIELTNKSTDVKGNVTITALTTNTVDTFAFELNKLITIDSILVDGAREQQIFTDSSLRKVALSTTRSAGTYFSVQVFYHGKPVSGNGRFFTGGLNYVKLSSGVELMYSLSDPDYADDWWPCKQSLTDKIDSVDMWVTVSSNLKAGSNGLLKNVTSMPGNKLRYEWKSNYPIDYYLITVAVAEYGDYSYYMHFTDGSNDSMLIQNYVYDSAKYMIPSRVAALDSTGYIVDHFSKLFGRYPFDKEKYGHCIAEPLGGGMEHQTMTTLAYAQTVLIAHELGHQWWGDHVTYSSWRDIWLSEGFASYCEQLFIEQFHGPAATLRARTTAFNAALQPSGSVYVDDTTSVNRIFSSQLTYNKGAAVAHMLRYVAPIDSLYFRALRQYQQQYAFTNAVTSDLQTIVQGVYGFNLDTFFNQWIYYEGFPTYAAKWYQDGSQVYIQLTQTTSRPASVDVFSMPLEFKLKSADGDTIVKFYNNMGVSMYSLPWSKTMTGLEIDPNNHVLNRTGTISKDAAVLKVNDAIFNLVKIYPNPTKDNWYISQLPPKATLKLTDIAGRAVWSAIPLTTEVSIPASALAEGTYVLTIELPDRTSRHYKLSK